MCAGHRLRLLFLPIDWLIQFPWSVPSHVSIFDSLLYNGPCFYGVARKLNLDQLPFTNVVTSA